MKKIVLFAVSILFIVTIALPFSLAQDQPSSKPSEKSSVEPGAEQSARDLFEVARLTEIGKSISNQLLQIQKKKMPDIPNQFWSDFSKKVDLKALNEKIIQLYITNLTVKEMKEITAFYKTETGQAFLNKLPLLQQETMMVGRQWGMALRMQITTKLQEVNLKAMKK